MKWTTKKCRDLNWKRKWHKWFAWYPITINSTKVWLCYVKRKELCKCWYGGEVDFWYEYKNLEGNE